MLNNSLCMRNIYTKNCLARQNNLSFIIITSSVIIVTWFAWCNVRITQEAEWINIKGFALVYMSFMQRAGRFSLQKIKKILKF